jgi:tripartite-type tricarboxylate transporter receptor subunit TctC
MLPGVAAATGLIASGKLRGLATTGAMRSSALPDVPTLAEQGYPDYEVTNWIGVVAPAATPRPTVERMARELQQALLTKEVASRLLPLGMEPVADVGPQAFGALLDSELAKWAKVVRDTGIHRE